MPPYITILYWFSWLILMFIWISTLRRGVKSPINISIFMFSLSVIFWLWSLYFAYLFADPNSIKITLFLTRLTFWFGVFVPFFIWTFFYYFPRKNIDFGLYFEIWYLLLNICVACLSIFTSYIYEANIYVNELLIQDKLGKLYFIFVIQFILNIIVSLYIAFRKIFEYKNIEKTRLIIITSWALCFILLVTFSHIILPLFNIYYLQAEIWTSSMIFSLSAFFTMHKYRFLNLWNLTLKIIRYTFIYSIFVIIMICLHWFLSFLWFDHFFNLIISSCLVILWYIFIEGKFPEIIEKNLKDFKTTILELKDWLYLCDTYEKFQNLFEQTFIVKHWISTAKIYVVLDTLKQNINIPYYLKNEFTEELCKYSNNLLLKHEIDFMNVDNNNKYLLKKWMEELGVDLCMPLFKEWVLIWIFTLWSKWNWKTYSLEEVMEILGLNKAIEICFMNILLKINLQEENDLMKKIINERTKDLQNQIKQQNDFMAVTAHELRTPLNIAMAQLEDTLENYKHPEDVLRDMNVVWLSLENLRQLTQVLFEVQQFDLNKSIPNKEKINIKEFMNNFYYNCKNLITQKSFRCQFINNISDINIFIDPVQIWQVMSNLTSNAMKFTPNNWLITMILTCDEQSVYISVMDTWPGIPDSEKENIFNKFETNHSTMWIWIWLWLYLSRKIIELHWWKIWAEDNPSWWAKLCISLPLNS